MAPAFYTKRCFLSPGGLFENSPGATHSRMIFTTTAAETVATETISIMTITTNV
ncbi:Uncharacterized protein dnm_040400 [Desulfonema magnum]|uniref:Uncharacterized protein n=1 Tax=Desulfonema magnum TaxID=45655 RepID=A0A975BN71_9BACT|nr:Uncharacterized protein dnm_040400 [Desulfonema magnum]